MRLTVLAGLFLSTAFLAGAEELTGFLADAKCAAGGKGGAAGHANCAKKCIEGGQDVVLVTGDKVYKIKNQEKVKAHAGMKATLTGKVEGDTIEVEKGRPAE